MGATGIRLYHRDTFDRIQLLCFRREISFPNATCCAGQLTCNFTWTSLTPKPMTVVFGLGTRLRVYMCTASENGVLSKGQQPGRAVTSFIDQGEFIAVKVLSGCKASCCDKHQFRDKMTVNT